MAVTQLSPSPGLCQPQARPPLVLAHVLAPTAALPSSASWQAGPGDCLPKGQWEWTRWDPTTKIIHVIMAAKNCRGATSPGGDPGLQAQSLLLPSHLQMAVTLESPCTPRRQGSTFREIKKPTQDHTARKWIPQGLGCQRFEVRGLLSTYRQLDAGDKVVNETNPCPQGASLLWGRGILKELAREQKILGPQSLAQPASVARPQAASPARGSLSSPSPEAPDKNSRSSLNVGTPSLIPRSAQLERSC